MTSADEFNPFAYMRRADDIYLLADAFASVHDDPYIRDISSLFWSTAIAYMASTLPSSQWNIKALSEVVELALCDINEDKNDLGKGIGKLNLCEPFFGKPVAVTSWFAFTESADDDTRKSVYQMCLDLLQKSTTQEPSGVVEI